MNNIISGPSGPVEGTIFLPSSKSISNRLLMIHSLGQSGASMENLSESDDTRVMKQAMVSSGTVKDVGHAGTAMRFLTAYYSVIPGKVVLTGSERMKQRPIGPLVEAFRELGARISYMEEEGYPPVEILGGGLEGGEVEIDGGISSQFISALMMVGPVLRQGLHITLKGNPVSPTYLRMTAGLMKICGVPVSMDDRSIKVPQMLYRMDDFQVESDWSAASYWFQVAALVPGSVIRLPRLRKESLQGDSVLVSLFELLGVSARFDGEGLEISSVRRDDRSTSAPREDRSSSGSLDDRSSTDPVRANPPYTYDFTGCPDLVQTMAVTLCAMGLPFRFTGTRTLRIKETDRIAALQSELNKLGFHLQSDYDGDTLSWDGEKHRPVNHPVIGTYHDHRMAMAFAPASAVFGPLSIEDPGVVSKSYPGFWEDLRKAGFTVNSKDHDGG